MDSGKDGPTRKVGDSPTVAILTALTDERSAVLNLLREFGGPVTDLYFGEGRIWHQGRLPSAGGKGVFHNVVVPAESRGQAAAAVCVAEVVNKFPSVRLVAFAGIAGGVPAIAIGDVVLPKRIVDLYDGRQNPGDFEVRGECPRLSPAIVSQVQALASDDEMVKRSWRAYINQFFESKSVGEHFRTVGERLKSGLVPTIHRVSIGTSNVVVNDRATREKFASSNDVRAFETESYGLSEAAVLFNRQYVVVRSISDHAAAKSALADRRDQPFASHVAAGALGFLLSRLPTWDPLSATDLRRGVGLFLDVDRTITRLSILEVYAKELGCLEEYMPIEAAWNSGPFEGNTQEFNDRMIPLFRQCGLTPERATNIAKKAALHEYARELLLLSKANPQITVYLVSSGPSFYVDWLAQEFQIPPENTLCSRYHFDEATGVLQDECEPVRPSTKGEFVMSRAGKHVITVGMGDHPGNDGQFLAQVTIPILTNPERKSPDFLTVQAHDTVKKLVDRIVGTLGKSGF